MTVLQSEPNRSSPAVPVSSWGAERLRVLARCWIVIAALAYIFDLWRQTKIGLSNGAGRPLGDDFINYWSGAALAWWHDARDVYSWHAFHAFEQQAIGATIDLYHYSYPPTLLVLTAPLAALPYLPALALWLLGSWCAFYRMLAAAWTGARRQDVILLAAASPAVFLNFVGGQNGAWTAALLGGGLVMLDRSPTLAGVFFGLMIYKPHLALLVPVALAAGGRWRAFGAAAVTAIGIVVLSAMLFGIDIWTSYADHIAVLRQTVLENGDGVWHRMTSVFVMARHFGMEVTGAYALQAVSGAIAAVAVAWAWYRNVPVEARNTLFVLGGFMAAPYLQDYDLVIGAFVVVWSIQMAAGGMMTGRVAGIVSAIVLIVPAVVAPVAKATGISIGAPALAVAFVLVVLASLPICEALANRWLRPHAVDDL